MYFDAVIIYKIVIFISNSETFHITEIRKYEIQKTIGKYVLYDSVVIYRQSLFEYHLVPTIY